MAFNTITISAKIFNSIGTGLYNLSTVAFGQPWDSIKIVGGKVVGKAKPVTTFSVTRSLEKDITEGDVVQRRKASITHQITVPQGFTMSEVKGLNDDLAAFLTSENLTRIAMGES